ncbi:hypothetical protein KC19_4G255400 [Ceratodon purpureus]|uniref:Uncharacterized protein n=1 Tax=Ceratodon purpureus TaxID=3225 RepID=A0A8T0IEY6_CERPU|nr:hypothetical protein KC19_4G255400 [Ceratodon purpureus]
MQDDAPAAPSSHLYAKSTILSPSPETAPSPLRQNISSLHIGRFHPSQPANTRTHTQTHTHKPIAHLSPPMRHAPDYQIAMRSTSLSVRSSSSSPQALSTGTETSSTPDSLTATQQATRPLPSRPDQRPRIRHGPRLLQLSPRLSPPRHHSIHKPRSTRIRVVVTPQLSPLDSPCPGRGCSSTVDRIELRHSLHKYALPLVRHPPPPCHQPSTIARKINHKIIAQAVGPSLSLRNSSVTSLRLARPSPSSSSSLLFSPPANPH